MASRGRSPEDSFICSCNELAPASQRPGQPPLPRTSCPYLMGPDQHPGRGTRLGLQSCTLYGPLAAPIPPPGGRGWGGGLGVVGPPSAAKI